MDIFEAIKKLENKSFVLIDSKGDKIQRYNDSMVYITVNKKNRVNNTIGYTETNISFLEKYKNETFEIKEQWYQKEYSLPILCWVTTPSWPYAKKLMMFSYVSGYSFQTGFGESYIPTAHVKIVPLTNKEIQSLKQKKKK